MCNRHDHIPYWVEDESRVEVCSACNGEGGYEQAVAGRWSVDPPSEWRTCAACDGKPFYVQPYEPEGPVPPISADEEIKF